MIEIGPNLADTIGVVVSLVFIGGFFWLMFGRD